MAWSWSTRDFVFSIIKACLFHQTRDDNKATKERGSGCGISTPFNRFYVSFHSISYIQQKQIDDQLCHTHKLLITNSSLILSTHHTSHSHSHPLTPLTLLFTHLIIHILNHTSGKSPHVFFILHLINTHLHRLIWCHPRRITHKPFLPT